MLPTLCRSASLDLAAADEEALSSRGALTARRTGASNVGGRSAGLVRPRICRCDAFYLAIEIDRRCCPTQPLLVPLHPTTHTHTLAHLVHSAAEDLLSRKEVPRRTSTDSALRAHWPPHRAPASCSELIVHAAAERRPKQTALHCPLVASAKRAPTEELRLPAVVCKRVNACVCSLKTAQTASARRLCSSVRAPFHHQGYRRKRHGRQKKRMAVSQRRREGAAYCSNAGAGASSPPAVPCLPCLTTLGQPACAD